MIASRIPAPQASPVLRRFLRGVAVWLLLPLAGGGCSDYSQQVAQTRQRLACLDAERDLLDEPAFLPDTPVRIFFRPPRGVAVKPAEASSAGDWLVHLPWTDTRAFMPPFEVLVGTYRREPQDRVAEFVQTKLVDRLRAHADENPTPRTSGSTAELTVTRWSDPPQTRRPVRYHRFAFHTDQEKPLWPAPRRADLPHRCVYNYDIYVSEMDDRWAVVVFKVLDRTATEEAWKKAGVKAELIQRIPDWRPRRVTVAVTEERIMEPRETSLATLLVGPPADARLRLIGR